MKNEYFVLALSFFACMVNADTTVTSTFTITNRIIEKSEISSTASGFTFSESNGLYKIDDNYPDANYNPLNFGNQQLGLIRNSSSVTIRMKGEKLGHTFNVLGKYADSSISISNFRNGFFNELRNNGCISVEPRGGTITVDTPMVIFSITSSSDVASNCIGRTDTLNFNSNNTRVTGNNRTFYLDINRLQNDQAYRNAPPDTYIGSGVYSGETIKNRVGTGLTPKYINNIKIIKNPYFESVTLPAADNVFETFTMGDKIQGHLVIPYAINGHFTPYNTISLNISSLNGFKLKHTSGSESIPYSLRTTIGSQRVYTLATDGVGSAAVTISNLEGESYSLQGRFNADFSIDKNTATTGDYSDTLTAIFQIAL